MTPRPRIGVTAKSGGSANHDYKLYAEAVEKAGGEPVWLEPETLAGLDPQEVVRDLNGLLLSGGADIEPHHFGQDEIFGASVRKDVQRDTVELPLARAALEADLPMLGICRGIQTLAVVAGGTLHQDLGLLGHDSALHDQRKAKKDTQDTSHPVRVAPDNQLAAAVGAGTHEVNSFHHQAVRDVPDGFVVTARSTDGVIEAIEDPHRAFVLGVQWHPERMVERHAAQRRLFEVFVEAAKNRRKKR